MSYVEIKYVCDLASATKEYAGFSLHFVLEFSTKQLSRTHGFCENMLSDSHTLLEGKLIYTSTFHMFWTI
jgi:hypothetical protein